MVSGTALARGVNFVAFLFCKELRGIEYSLSNTSIFAVYGSSVAFRITVNKNGRVLLDYMLT
jgi:hypothetical protein